MPDQMRPPVVLAEMADVRLDYQRRFPGWTQQLITVFSGKAAPGQRPPRLLPPPIVNWLLTLVQLAVAVPASACAVRLLGWWAVLVLPFTWLVTVNAVRKLQVTWSHHAVHNEVSRNKRVDRVVQVVSSAISLTSNYEDIFEDHVRNHHNRRVFTSVQDPDSAFLVYLGFVPGTPLAGLRARLYRTCLSPRFHFAYVVGRTRTNFVTASWSRRAGSAVWVAVLVFLATRMDTVEFVLAIVVPWFVLFHWAALFQTISEHPWMAFEHPPASRADYASRCWARFCLEPLPGGGGPLGMRIVRWGRWLARTVLLHTPARFGVLVSDLPAHDLHHVVPNDHAWHHAFWHRQAQVDAGHESRLGDRELTLGQAVEQVLTGISRATRSGPAVAPESSAR